MQKRNWTPYAILGIALLVGGFYFLIQADYRPTGTGTDVYNVIAGICFVGFVGLCVAAVVKTKKRI